MKIAFLGTGDFAVPALLALRPDRHRVLCAISQPDRPAGRGRTIQPTPVHLAADAHQIEHFQTTDINADAAVLERLAEADLAIVAAFGQKLAADTLRRPRLGCVNIHGSLLPKYRGAAPYQWAVINGDETTGVTIFQIDEQWDAGPIWGVRSTPIGETETADELHDRLATIGAELLVDFLSKLEAGEATPMPQNASAATRAPKLKKSDGMVDWSRDARSVVRRVNGLWSWPAANVRFIAAGGKAEMVQLARAEIAQADSAAGSDSNVGALRADGGVQCGRGAIRILEIKPAGGKLMPFDAFRHGRDASPPARFSADIST